MAQLGSALDWGSRGRGFKSRQPDDKNRENLFLAVFYMRLTAVGAPGYGGGLKDKKSWSEPDLSALWCEKVWFKVVGGQL